LRPRDLAHVRRDDAASNGQTEPGAPAEPRLGCARGLAAKAHVEHSVQVWLGDPAAFVAYRHFGHRR
jgi:hypothetical protein